MIQGNIGEEISTGATVATPLVFNSKQLSQASFEVLFCSVCVHAHTHPCMSLCVFHVYRNLQKPKEGGGFSALDGCKPPCRG